MRDVADNAAGLVEHYEYDSFGNVLSGDKSLTRYLFTSREWDADISLQFNRARWYDAGVGRWLSTDPIGFSAGDANLYRYVGNVATVFIDPSGLAPNQEHATDPEYLLERVEELEDEGLSIEDILKTIKDDYNTTAEHRYVYTDEFGWIDLRHFAAAAEIAHGLGPAGWEVSNTLGLANEIWQWFREGEDDYHSGFSPEDIPSNSAGGDFGENYAGHHETLADALELWFDDAGARAAADPKAGFGNLPATDPAFGAGGGSSSGGTAPSGSGGNVSVEDVADDGMLPDPNPGLEPTPF